MHLTNKINPLVIHSVQSYVSWVRTGKQKSKGKTNSQNNNKNKTNR